MNKKVLLLMFLLLLVLASASDRDNKRQLIQEIERNYHLWTENDMLKMTLNHYEQEYGLGNIRRIQNENLHLLIKNDELERTIKILRKQLISTREKLNDLKNDALKSLINSKTCARPYKFHKHQNVEQQTDTRILEHEDTNVIETCRKCFEAKLKKKNTIYKKIDKNENFNVEKSNEHDIERKNLLNKKLKIDAIENANEYKALIAKCTKLPIFDKKSDEIKVFLNLLDVKNDNSFGHGASACRLKISANDKLELYNFNGKNEQIITFDMKMPIKITISNEGILEGLLKNELFELQLISFENKSIRLFYLISNQFGHALVLIYKSRENQRNYTLKKTDKPESIDLLKAHKTENLKIGTEFKRVTVNKADINVIYMEMDDFTNAIKRKLKQDLSN